MAHRQLNRKARTWVIGILLVALALRALVPVGFMPSADEPFSLQICPDGFPAQLLHHQHGSHHEHAVAQGRRGDDSVGGAHQHGPSGSEHCLFAAAAGIGPVPHTITLAVSLDSSTTAPGASLPAPFTHVRYRISQPRGPPSPA